MYILNRLIIKKANPRSNKRFSIVFNNLDNYYLYSSYSCYFLYYDLICLTLFILYFIKDIIPKTTMVSMTYTNNPK